ncbi:MAG: hypothetical protein ACO3K7_04790 [Candidatus Marinamargulisbacteria bacterium]
MKKSLLSLLFVLAITTVASAAPRFGVIGEQGSGLGAFITDDMYNAQLTFGSSDVKDGDKESIIGVAANYKVALDSVTSLLLGVDYNIFNSDADSFDSQNRLAFVTGFERALSSNIILLAKIDAYSKETYKPKTGSKTEVTRLFSNARVGVAYLF